MRKQVRKLTWEQLLKELNGENSVSLEVKGQFFSLECEVDSIEEIGGELRLFHEPFYLADYNDPKTEIKIRIEAIEDIEVVQYPQSQKIIAIKLIRIGEWKE